MHCSHHFDLLLTTKYHILSFILSFYKEVISRENLKTLFTDGEYPKFCDLWWNWWIQVQADNFNGFLFCSLNSSQFFDWNFEMGIENNLDPIRITRSKNSSSCTIKNIPNFWIFFKSSFTNQRHEVDNNRCSTYFLDRNSTGFVYSFQIYFLVWNEAYWKIYPINFCRYLSSGNIKYSVKPLSKNSKILADISGPTNWRDVLT